MKLITSLCRCFELLETLFFRCLQLWLHLLLRFLLGFEPLFLCIVIALHSTLCKSLIADKSAVHTFHEHLARSACLLDAIAVVLVRLIVPCVILGLRHGASEP